MHQTARSTGEAAFWPGSGPTKSVTLSDGDAADSASLSEGHWYSALAIGAAGTGAQIRLKVNGTGADASATSYAIASGGEASPVFQARSSSDVVSAIRIGASTVTVYINDLGGDVRVNS